MLLESELCRTSEYLPVLLDGVILGRVHFSIAEKLTENLRVLKNPLGR